MKILVEGDSYGLPRFSRLTGNVCLDYLETYPYQLQKILADKFHKEVYLVNRCRHANTSYSLVSGECDELLLLKPDLCVIELGLTDLWPAKGRNVEPLQKELKDNDPWVSCEDYKKFLSFFTKRTLEAGSVIEIVGVPMVAQYHLLKHKNLKQKIERYSLAAAEIAKSNESTEFVDWTFFEKYDLEQPVIGEDGIHPTPYGSNLLAQKLAEKYFGLMGRG